MEPRACESCDGDGAFETPEDNLDWDLRPVYAFEQIVPDLNGHRIHVRAVEGEDWTSTGEPFDVGPLEGATIYIW